MKPFLVLWLSTIVIYNVESLSTPATQPPSSSQSQQQVKSTIRNLLSISTHLQNPDLYSPAWANCCTLTTPSPTKKKKKKKNDDEEYTFLASRDIQKGELITLYPVHAIGLKSTKDGNDEENVKDAESKSAGTGVGLGMGMGGGIKKSKKKQTIRKRIAMNQERFLQSYNYLYHDSKWDFDLTIPNMRPHQHEVQIPILSSSSKSHSLFGIHPNLLKNAKNNEYEWYIQSHPRRKLLPGWYGHLIPTKPYNVKSMDIQKTNHPNNCILVPLPCSIPLCGIVANRDIEKGEVLIREQLSSQGEKRGDHNASGDDTGDDTGNNDGDDNGNYADITMDYVKLLVKRYTPELSELGSYYKMAFQSTSQEEETEPQDHNRDNHQSSLSPLLFHQINESYPNLEKLHSDPDIYIIPDFLSSEECDRLVQKASPHQIPCLIKSEESGTVQNDPTIRTSTNANIPRAEVPSITEKITQLTNCSEEHLEIYQVLKYEKGQEFKPHTDGFDGPVTACGFFNSGRIATLFCYLNDVEEGGKTMFNKIGIDVKPKKGTAVLHFPMSLDMVEDERTEHEGSKAVDTKWILTTWVWKDERLDERYSESNLQPLSDDII